jgi:peptidoglycan/LPS O-acetylase OafA/YrhL
MRLVASSLHFYDIHYVLGETIQQYFALAVALAVIAMFNQLAKPGPVLKYFVDASYTLYLVHMPVIVVLHTLLASLHLHWSVEYPVIVCVTSGLCLLFHHQIVARVPLAGFLLNGTKLALKSGSNQVITAPVTS